MVPGLGKQTIVVGSAPHCDIRLGGPGVAPEHARIVHQGGGALVFVDLGAGPTTGERRARLAGLDAAPSISEHSSPSVRRSFRTRTRRSR